MTENKAARRDCGECDVCCRGWLKINTDEIKIPIGEACQHLSDVGCGIYTTRPENPCRTFFCGWAAEDSPLPEWMQPHNSRAIVLFNAIQWQGYTFDQVVPVGEEIPRKTIEWLLVFFKAHNRMAVIGKNEMQFNGKPSGKVMLMIFAPEPVKSQLEAWCQKGNDLLNQK